MSITIAQQPPNSAEAVELIAELDEYLMGHPYPPESRHAFTVERLVNEGVSFFILKYDDRLAACGGIKMFADYGEVKRMYVRPEFRGAGLGKAVLNRLADYAREHKARILRLETGIFQVEAIGMYDRLVSDAVRPLANTRTIPIASIWRCYCKKVRLRVGSKFKD